MPVGDADLSLTGQGMISRIARFSLSVDALLACLGRVVGEAHHGREPDNCPFHNLGFDDGLKSRIPVTVHLFRLGLGAELGSDIFGEPNLRHYPYKSII